MRHKYVMRKVVDEQDWIMLPYGNVSTRDVLECGHIRRQEIIDSTSDALRILARAMSRREVRRRCYECAKNIAINRSIHP